MRRISAAVLLLSVVAPAAAVHSSEVHLTWNTNTEPDLAGYTLHWGSTPGNYSASAYAGSEARYTVTDLEGGATYFFAVTAIDSSGNESGYSSEISATPSPSAPEVVSTPAAPSGSTAGSPKRNYTFLTSGSLASDGGDVQYRFDWGDGTLSNWIPARSTSTKKSWKETGTYLVRAQARCADHQEVQSDWSAILTVEISRDTEPPPPPGKLRKKNRV